MYQGGDVISLDEIYGMRAKREFNARNLADLFGDLDSAGLTYASGVSMHDN